MGPKPAVTAELRLLPPVVGLVCKHGSLSPVDALLLLLQHMPRFKRLPPLHTYIMMGNGPGWSNSRDPLAVGLDEELG
jgi:hypothetical protein